MKLAEISNNEPLLFSILKRLHDADPPALRESNAVDNMIELQVKLLYIKIKHQNDLSDDDIQIMQLGNTTVH